MPEIPPPERERTPPWGDLAALTVDRVSATVEDMHRAIARPWFRLAGPAGEQLREAYTNATSVVYRSVRMIARGGGRMSDTVVRNSTSRSTGRSDAVQAFANAVWGDEMERQRSAMAIEMAVRDRFGTAIPLDPDSLSMAFPTASNRILLLLHGLGQTERRFLSRNGSRGLADALESSSWTPVPVRYNSGLAVPVNGRDLAELLGELIDHWPVPVTEVAFVGYSMGGLVARAAIDSGRAEDDRWTTAVRHVVTIAAPHSGSPIEKAVEMASRSLMVAPQTRPLGGFLAQRSAGIRDLHSGVDLPPSFDGVEHHVVAAVMTSDADSRLGALVGDLVVRPSSAIGRLTLSADSHAVIGGRRHYDILDDPSIADRVLGWIAADRDGDVVSGQPSAAT